MTVAKVVDPLTKAAAESSWDVDDPFSVAIPFRQLAKRPGDAFELALVVSREGRDIEVVPPSGALGLRVPGQATEVEVPQAQHLKVLVATAELAPFAKLGGVSDVAAALSKELMRLGHDVGFTYVEGYWGSGYVYDLDIHMYLHRDLSYFKVTPDGAQRRTQDAGVSVVCSTDAHSVQGLDNMRLSVTTARRGRASAADILNTRPLAEILRP